MMSGRPPRFHRDLNPSVVALLELFDQPIPDLPGVPPVFLDLLRIGMANDPLARPIAPRLRELLADLVLDREPRPDAVRGSAAVPPPRTPPEGPHPA
jgi:hypothetical protein